MNGERAFELLLEKYTDVVDKVATISRRETELEGLAKRARTDATALENKVSNLKSEVAKLEEIQGSGEKVWKAADDFLSKLSREPLSVETEVAALRAAVAETKDHLCEIPF